MKELLKKLIQADTTQEKGELAAAEIVSAELSRSGINSKIDKWEQTRANIIAHVKSEGPEKALLFACHLDVVGPGEAKWQNPPFEAIESDGKIYGRGSTDMKGGIAAVVTAVRQIVDSGTKLNGDIVFAAVAGEEVDSCGADRFISNCTDLPEFTGIIIPEPTDFMIVTAHRGMLWLKVTTKGKTAHGSTPHLGVNAISSMQSVLNELENYEIDVEPHKLLGECSMSINTIAGGKAVNVVPDKCSIEIDIRTLPGQNHQNIIADLEKIFAKLKSENPQFDADIRIIRQVGALEADCNNDFVKNFCSVVGTNETEAVGFTTDGPHFAPLDAPVVIFGPGKPELCHKPDEYINICDVEKAAEYYKTLILRLLG
ncbi:MAG: M20 family metallopeptidase [Phycisphaerales bacterium]|jgi:succinyl-diaminopimelate desuccinylase